MVDLLEIRAFRAADALYYALGRIIEGWSPEEALRSELQEASADILAQTIYAILCPQAEMRDRARDELKRATRRIAILVEVAQTRGRVDHAAAAKIMTCNAALWHEIRTTERDQRKQAGQFRALEPRRSNRPTPKSLPRTAQPPSVAASPDALLTPPRRLAPTVPIPHWPTVEEL